MCCAGKGVLAEGVSRQEVGRTAEKCPTLPTPSQAPQIIGRCRCRGRVWSEEVSGSRRQQWGLVTRAQGRDQGFCKMSAQHNQGLPHLSKASARGPETRPLVYHIRHPQRNPSSSPENTEAPLQGK